MASREELLYVIRGDNRLSSELREARGQVKSTDRSVNTLNKSLGKVKNVVGGLALGAAFSAGARGIQQSISKVREFRRETAKLTDAQGGRLDNIVTKTKAVADTYDKEYNEVLKTANTAAERFETTQTRALEMINKGFLEGGKNADDFLKQVREYSGAFKEAGFDAQQFFGTIIAGTKSGSFQDKMPDAIKEGAMSLREQTKPVQDALQNAFGEETAEQFEKGIESGSLNARDALIKLNKEIKTSNPNAQELQQLIADIFKGPGEDLGMDLIRNLNKMTQSMKEQKGEMNSLTKHQKEMRQEYEKLAASQNRLARETEEFGNVYNQIWTGIKNEVFDKLADINRGLLRMTGQATVQDFGKGEGRKEGAGIVSDVMQQAKEKAMDPESKGGEKFTPEEVRKKQIELLKQRRKKLDDQAQEASRRSHKLNMQVEKQGMAGDVGVVNDAIVSGITKTFSLGYADADAGYFGSNLSEREAAEKKVGRTQGKLSEVSKALAKLRQKQKEDQNRVLDFGGDDETDPLNAGSENLGKDGKPKSRADRIVSQAPDSINIEIGKLIETFNIITENLDEGAEESKEKILQAIFTAINNGQAAGNR